MENIVFSNASHGGFDGGAVAEDGTIEKNINFSQVLQEALLSKVRV